MSTFTSLVRRCATGLVAAQVMFGAVSVATLAAAAPAQAASALVQHGDWQGFITKIDGHKVYGAITRMQRGGTAAFLVRDRGLILFLTDPSWHLGERTDVPVTVTIDGRAYTMHADVHDGSIVMENIQPEVLKMFADGARAEVDVQHGSIVWTLDLDGFSASMSDAIKLVQV